MFHHVSRSKCLTKKAPVGQTSGGAASYSTQWFNEHHDMTSQIISNILNYQQVLTVLWHVWTILNELCREAGAVKEKGCEPKSVGFFEDEAFVQRPRPDAAQVKEMIRKEVESILGSAWTGIETKSEGTTIWSKKKVSCKWNMWK